MSHDDASIAGTPPAAFTRRNFIKGVIAGGVGVSSAAYLFREQPAGLGPGAEAGASNGCSR